MVGGLPFQWDVPGETVRVLLLLISLDHHWTLSPVRLLSLSFNSGAFPTAFTEIPPL